MKTINKYIAESIQSNKRVFNADELYKDYEAADDATGQEKKDLIAKYGIN